MDPCLALAPDQLDGFLWEVPLLNAPAGGVLSEGLDNGVDGTTIAGRLWREAARKTIEGAHEAMGLNMGHFRKPYCGCGNGIRDRAKRSW